MAAAPGSSSLCPGAFFSGVQMITVTSNLSHVIDGSRRLHPQFQFAAAVALTQTLKAARDAMPSISASVLDRPSAFTQQGFFLQAARKDNLQASVGVKDRQAEYLRYQIEGGTRRPSRKALRLPSVVQLDEFGNVPKGLIRQLVARAKAGRRATKAQAGRFRVSQGLDLFYGEPGNGRPAGIYKRVPIGTTREQLVPIIVFPVRSATYARRFDFHGAADRVVRARFAAELDKAWDMALRTAR